MKKIMMFHHNSRISGAGISGRNIVRAIDKTKYEVVVYCSTHGAKDTADLFAAENVRVIQAGDSPAFFEHCVGSYHFPLSPRFLRNIVQITKDKKKVERSIAAEKPDIIILNSMTLFWIAGIAKKYNIKCMLFFRETWIHGLWGIRNKYISKEISKNVDTVAFISRFDYEESVDILCNKTVIYNAIEYSDIEEKKGRKEKTEIRIDSGKCNLLFVGGMSALKGIHILLESMKELDRSEYLLHVVGYTWNGKVKTLSDCNSMKSRIKYIFGLDFEKKCQQMIVDGDLQDRICFYPSDDNIGRFYRVCDALVFPMSRPHQARPLFEAGLAKIPCLISSFSNIAEFASEECCYLFEPNSPHALADAIREMRADVDNRQRKEEKNYAATIKRHGFESYKIAIQEAVDELVKEK